MRIIHCHTIERHLKYSIVFGFDDLVVFDIQYFLHGYITVAFLAKTTSFKDVIALQK